MAIYVAALDRAVALDKKIMGDAARARSLQYADIVALPRRRTINSLDITIGTDASGNVAPSDIMIFMRNMGTNRRANPMERIYVAFPMFLYINVSLCGALFTPLLASQPASLSGQTYAGPTMDIGGQYPVAKSDSAAYLVQGGGNHDLDPDDSLGLFFVGFRPTPSGKHFWDDCRSPDSE